MPSSPTISLASGVDRELIGADEVQALKATGTLIIDERRSRTRYFDGRFMAARDEIRDQNYFLTRLADIGRAGGTGVSSGLTVSLAGPGSVMIAPGQGVTPAGETVIVSSAATISLANLAATEQLDVAFGISRVPQPLARNRSGIFVLGLRPVEYTANPVASYPRSVDGPRSVQDGDIIEAAAVVLVPYVEQDSQAHADTRRARIARRVFVDQGALGAPDDVLPLAMLSIDRGVISWLDSYMVRRELGAGLAGSAPFGFSPTPLRRAHILQYLNQIREVMQTRAASNLGQGFAASDYFEVLPAAGAMPAASINPAGFSQVFFPPQIQAELSIVPNDELNVLIEESLLLPPFDLTDSAEELESTSVLILVPVSRKQFPSIRQSLTSATSSLHPAAPGVVAQRRPIESLVALTARIRRPPPNPVSPIDAAWRQALGQNSMLWFVRRRNLQVRRDVARTAIRVPAGNDSAAEQALAARLSTMGLAARFTALKAKSTAAGAAVVTGLLESPVFADRVLAEAVFTNLEVVAQVDQATALNVTARFSVARIGEGIAKVEAANAGIIDPAVIKAIAIADVAPELDRAGTILDKDALTELVNQVVTIAKSGAADASPRIAALVRAKVSIP